MRVKRWRPKKYLALFQESHRDLLEECQIGQAGEFERTVYKTWKMSFDQLSSAAQDLLRMIAFMHHSDIPEEIFRRAHAISTDFKPAIPLTDEQNTAMTRIFDFLSPFQTQNLTWDTLKFSGLVSELESYSLICPDPDKATYNIHPLVHLWARSSSASTDMDAGPAAWLLALAAGNGDSSTDHAFRRTLVPHISALPLTAGFSCDVASSLARVYYENGKLDLAESLQKEALETSRRSLGQDHLCTLSMLSSLAVTYQSQRRWTDAHKLQEEELEARRHIQDERHPGMLTCMHNLASTYGHLGRSEEAERLRLKVLKTRTEVLGKEDPDTLASMHNLATMYKKQRRWKEAEGLGIEVLRVCRHVFKDEHPKTLMAMNTLATTYQFQKKWAQAEELRAEAVKISKRVYEGSNPRTLSTMKKLLVVYEKQGKTQDAELLRHEIDQLK